MLFITSKHWAVTVTDPDKNLREGSSGVFRHVDWWNDPVSLLSPQPIGRASLVLSWKRNEPGILIVVVGGSAINTIPSNLWRTDTYTPYEADLQIHTHRRYINKETLKKLMLWITSIWFNSFLAQQRDGDTETKEDILKKMFELFLSVLWTMKIYEVQNNTEKH